MNNDDEIIQLLRNIRDNQNLALLRQEEHLDIARRQLDRAKIQVAESIELQKAAMKRFRTVSIIAIPGIIVCIVLIIYLVVRYL